MEKKNKGPFAFVLILALTIGALAAQFGWSLSTGRSGQAPFLLTAVAFVVAYKLLMLIPSLRKLVNQEM